MRQLKTHFEQIAVEVVKKIADRDGPDAKKIESDNLIHESAAEKPDACRVPASRLGRKGV